MRYASLLVVSGVLLLHFQSCVQSFHHENLFSLAAAENETAAGGPATAAPSSTPTPTLTPTPGASAGSGDTVAAGPELQWFLAQHPKTLKSFKNKFGVANNPTGWWEGWSLRAYVDMFEATGDREVLRQLNELLRIVYDGNDLKTGFKDDLSGEVRPGWGGTYGGAYGASGGARYSDHTLNGLYLYPLAAFARIVKEDPALGAEFGTSAGLYLELVEKSFDVFTPDANGERYADGSSGRFERYHPNYYEAYNGRQEYYGNVDKPVNLVVVPAEAYVEAYRATKKKKFADYAEDVSKAVWWRMRYGSNTEGITWLYWAYWPGRPAGYAEQMEDVSHGALTAKFAVSMVRAGLRATWSEAHLQYLANTFKYSVMTSSTKMRWHMNDPGSPAVPDAQAYLCSDWAMLTPYDRTSSSNVHAWCEKIMGAAGADTQEWPAVFAILFRYDPNRAQ